MACMFFVRFSRTTYRPFIRTKYTTRNVRSQRKTTLAAQVTRKLITRGATILHAMTSNTRRYVPAILGGSIQAPMARLTPREQKRGS